jgi:hypothetical protein
MFFLAVHGIESYEMALEAKFSKQSLCCGNLIGFIFNVDVGEHQRRVSGKGSQHLRCGTVMKIIETATQGFAIERHAAPSLRRCRLLQLRGVATKNSLDGFWIKPLQYVAYSGMGRGAAPIQSESFVQTRAMGVDESHDPTVGIAAGYHREDRKQQNMRKLI